MLSNLQHSSTFYRNMLFTIVQLTLYWRKITTIHCG